MVIPNLSTQIMNRLHFSSCTIQHSCLHLLNDCGLKCLIYQILKVQYYDDLSATYRRTNTSKNLKPTFETVNNINYGSFTFCLLFWQREIA